MKTFGTDNAHWSKVSRRAGALVVSLVFIILITIVLVGFVTTASLERSTVQSHYGRIQADLFSVMAVDVVASRISMASSQTNTWWVSQPGRIAATPFVNNSSTPTTTFYELNSGAAGAVVSDVSVNLNPASLTQSSGVVVGDPATILPVKWIYVRHDGTQTTAQTTAPAYDKNNPWVGRYAYWADDESGRININTASMTNAAVKLDLTTLSSITTAAATDIQNARTTRPFNSAEEVRSAHPAASTALTENKASLTHRNQSSDLNRFGESRIVLTTQASIANGRPYFNILTTDNSDPGITANIDKTKIEALFSKLYSYFGKTTSDWGLPGPVTFNKTLINKYTDKGAAQLIVNLIDYVRSLESAEPLILPIRGAFQAPTFTYDVAGYAGNGNYGVNAMRGNSRRLHLVETGVYVPVAPISNVTLKVKIYCDTGIVTPVSLLGLSLQYNVSSPTLSFAKSNYIIAATDVVEADKTIGPGEYRTLSITVPFSVPVPSRPAAGTNLAMRLAIKSASGYSYDIAPIVDYPGLSSLYIQYPMDADTVALADMTSVSTGDPVTNQCNADWTPSGGGNTFGSQARPPQSAVGTVPYAYEPPPQQDTDSVGNITDVGAQQPTVKGSSANPDGLIKSVGEIGLVHSGGKGTSVKGTPWRTIRLQPRVNNGILPDWVLLDLFTAPVQAANATDAAILRPTTDAIAGRIGLNAVTVPFTTTQWSRTTPLKTLLRSIKPSLTGAEADVLAGNILNQTLATGPRTLGTAFGPTEFTADHLYPMPGEICEIKGIADEGEASEALARSLVGHLTTRSNVFSVFSVGEKIQQLPNGTIKVMGTTRTRTVLERYKDGGTWKVRALSTTELGI